MSKGIDANSTFISVVFDIEQLSVRVTDNGNGVLPSDLENIGLPYHSSKWTPSGPTQTFGFKGSALASIASLSVLTVTSRHVTQAAAKSIRISYNHRSKVYSPRDFGPNHGTLIVVSGLFSRLPVRKKHIHETPVSLHLDALKQAILPIAITKPHVTISIHDSNNKSLLHIPSITTNLIPRHIMTLRAIYGSYIINRWQTVHTIVNGFDVKGTIAFDPARTKLAQHIIVNSKRLENFEIYKELNDLFTVMSSSHFKNFGLSMVYIFEVKFECSFDQHLYTSVIYDTSTENFEFLTNLLKVVVKKFLKKHGYLIDKKKGLKSLKFGNAPTGSNTDILIYSSSRTARMDINELKGRLSNQPSNRNINDQFCSLAEHRVSMPISKQLVKNNQKFLFSQSELINKYSHVSSKYFFPKNQVFSGLDLTTLEKRFNRNDLASLKLISQVETKFLLVTINSTSASGSQKCLAIIDQHAADERVKLEALFTETTATALANSSTPLAHPVRISLSDTDHHILAESVSLFRQFGIVYHLSSQKWKKPFVLLTHVPEIAMRKIIPTTETLDTKFAHKLLIGHINDVSKHRTSSALPDLSLHWSVAIRSFPVALIELLQSKACRSAIMFGDLLTLEQCKILISNLSNCMFPFQCAHGRPSMVPLIYI